MNKTSFIFYFLFFWIPIVLVGQQKNITQYTIAGRVVNALNAKEGVAFAHGYDFANRQHFLTDENGAFQLSGTNPFYKISFKSDLHQKTSFVFNKQSETDSITVLMPRVYPWPNDQTTTTECKTFVKQLVKNKVLNDPDRVGHYKCGFYQKLSVVSDSLEAIKSLINAGFRIFGQPVLDTKAPFHCLFLAETHSNKYFYSEDNQKELMDGIKLSGIQQFSGNLPLTQLDAFSIYSDYVTLEATDYIGPLAGNPLRRYQFSFVDTIPLTTDTLIVVRFMPLKGKKVNSLRGYMLVSSRDYGVQASIYQPGLIAELQTTLSQYYTRTKAENHNWAPSHYQARLVRLHAVGNVPIEITQQGYVTQFEYLDRKLHLLPSHLASEWDFDGVNMEPVVGASHQDSTFWAQNRYHSLSVAEHNTYHFYNKMGSIKSVDKLLSLTEELYFGLLSYDNWSLDLNKMIGYNYYESLRLGIGVTKYWNHHKLSTGGYLASGLLDKANKYGFQTSYLIDSLHDIRIGYKYFNDLVEPGQSSFFKDQPIYSSERLRKYIIPRFDQESTHQISITSNLRPNITVQLASNFRIINPLYQYKFNAFAFEQPEVSIQQFRTYETKIGLHWAIGEHFIKFKRNLISLGSKWPLIQANFTSGTAYTAGLNLIYERYDLKVSHKFRGPGWGNTGIQLLAGKITGVVPYPLLWTGRPSYQEVNAVITNSFETMRFNEFLADQFLAIFAIHILEPIEIEGFPYNPYFSIVHNMAWGSLSNRNNHLGVNTNSLDQGYYESGFFINDVFVFNLAGLEIGVGVGAFVRYGAAALPSQWDNTATKFALRFGI